jgi:uncharacterized membrane protein
MRFPLRRAMTVLALLGIALATYLTIVHYAGLKPACTAGQACVKVQTSQWSKLDGVPVALIGLIGYVMIVGALLAPDREETRLAVLGMTMVGFGFSAYLTYRELFSIHAICEECATSAVFMTILLICAVYRYLTTNEELVPIPEATPLPPRGAKAQRPAREKPRRKSPTV